MAAALVLPLVPHLHRHLCWLLADASAPSSSSAPLVNEHWKDLVVAVRDDVLIPRPETEAVLDMVGTPDCERVSWSSPSSSSAVASRLGGIAVPCVDVSISFTDHRLHEVGRRGLEFMPFLLSLSVFLFGTSWFIYALLGLDPFIFDLILVENIGAKLVRLKILELKRDRQAHGGEGLLRCARREEGRRPG